MGGEGLGCLQMHALSSGGRDFTPRHIIATGESTLILLG